MLSRWRESLIPVCAGAVAGFTVLGVGGRAAMAALPLATGARPRFSWSGSLEVVFLGAIYGILGGFVLLALRRVVQPSVVVRGSMLGALMLCIAWAASAVGRATATTAPVSVPIVLVIAALLFIAYGMATEALARRWRGSLHRSALRHDTPPG